MARFEVVGRWRDSGEPATLRVRATDAGHAESIAEKRGMQVDYAHPHRGWFLWANVASITTLSVIILINHIRLHGLQAPWNIDRSPAAQAAPSADTSDSARVSDSIGAPEAPAPRVAGGTVFSPPPSPAPVPPSPPSVPPPTEPAVSELPPAAPPGEDVAAGEAAANGPTANAPGDDEQSPPAEPKPGDVIIGPRTGDGPMIRIVPRPDTPEPDECQSCKGTAQVHCVECEGVGYTFHEEVCRVDATGGCAGVGHRDCFTCRGAGTRRCTACNGSGGYRLNNGKKRDCTQCEGKGRRTCLTCDRPDRGKVGVPPVGRITCPRCGGTGRVKLRVDCSACERGKVACPDCKPRTGD
jgi:hypothetical protein